MSQHHPCKHTATGLTAIEREALEHRLAAEPAARGRLMAVVEIRVYENGAVPEVAFPPASPVGLEATDREIVGLLRSALVSLETRLGTLTGPGGGGAGRSGPGSRH